MVNSYILKKKIKTLEGVYLGEVVQSRDDFGANRVKVRLLGITDKIPIEALPYYSLKAPVSDSPNANVSVPPVGAKVEVELRGDIYNGVVTNNNNEISPH